MSKKFFVKLVTAEQPYFEGDCEALKIPAFDGMMGVYAGHAPFVSELGTGIAEIRINDSDIRKFAVQNGFIQIAENEVIILAERACKPEEVAQDELKQQLERTREEMLKQGSLEEKDKALLDYRWLKANEALLEDAVRV